MTLEEDQVTAAAELAEYIEGGAHERVGLWSWVVTALVFAAIFAAALWAAGVWT